MTIRSAKTLDPSVIERYARPQIELLWKNIKAGPTRFASGKALEYLVVRAFELDGATVRYPFEDRDRDGFAVEQIDGVVHSDHLSCVIEAKDQKSAVDFGPIAKLAGRLMTRPSPAVGLVVSRSGFTRPARMSARFLVPQSILLWEGDELDLALTTPGGMRKGLMLKYQKAIEHGVPDYMLKAGVLP
jgi:hypothetical protein